MVWEKQEHVEQAKYISIFQDICVNTSLAGALRRAE